LENQNKVFIGCSLDGFIAEKDGGLAFLDIVPNPDKLDLGYYSFMNGIDALLMGRNTFDTVLGFGIPWPYKKPVYVLSNSLSEIPEEYADKAILVKGKIHEALEHIHQNGHHRLYIDGGKIIQSFLKEDLIDEMVITNIPILLGSGIPLFGELNQHLEFELLESTTLLDHIVQRKYRRKRES